jgi:TfoX/Sxy family transcriptional regulator of competence genes
MMAYDEGVAQRIREVLDAEPDIIEKKMFGGLAFMVRGHMCVGVTGSELMARVGSEQYEAALALPHAREMDFTGQALKGFIYVAEKGFADDSDLQKWVGLSLAFVGSLPPK